MTEDAPFYIREQSLAEDVGASVVPSEPSYERQSSRKHGRRSKGPTLTRVDSNGSEINDLRSVIDDLTVENKWLKQKLRKYEGLHCSHLQDDKLFEVRSHGLAAHKKKQLEEMLRRFAASLQQSPSRLKTTSSPRPLDRAPVNQPVPMDSSTSTCRSRPADSAYASMFPSGDTNVSKLHDEPPRARVKKAVKRDLDSPVRRLPEGPMVADQLRKSERTKKKLVVRRLEQLFAGKEAAPKACIQHLQQQEVAQSAGRADRTSKKADAHRVFQEGVREARILPADAESLAYGTRDGRDPAKLRAIISIRRSSARFRNEEVDACSNSPPEQRPTRPLDIDPNRAQVPADNLDYIRHLGFSSSTVAANATGQGWPGWVYLNLLISMAQIHTINVTPDFVREAVAEVSERFELSGDGRKIRWKGGTEETRMSSDVDSSGEPSEERSPDDPAGRRRKRRRLANNRLDGAPLRPERELASDLAGMLQHPKGPSTDHGHTTKSKRVFFGRIHKHNGPHYKPLFRHPVCSGEDKYWAHTSNSATSLDFSAALAANASTTQNLARNMLEPKYGDGPIIFYQGANFCTDLSGDTSYLVEEAAGFGSMTQTPLGSTRINSRRSLNEVDNLRRPLRTFEASPDRMDFEEGYNHLNLADFQLPTVHWNTGGAAYEGIRSLQLEASGIGGVQPCDNFTVNVHIRHVISFSGHGSYPARNPQKHRLLHDTTSQETLEEKPLRLVMKSEIVSTAKTSLPPSSLPPPSYYLSLSTSETDEDDHGTESDSTDSSANDLRSSWMEAELSAPNSPVPLYRTAGSGRRLDISDFESEDSNLDGNDDAW